MPPSYGFFKGYVNSNPNSQAAAPPSAFYVSWGGNTVANTGYLASGVFPSPDASPQVPANSGVGGSGQDNSYPTIPLSGFGGFVIFRYRPIQ
jgi:hypothetical protein